MRISDTTCRANASGQDCSVAQIYHKMESNELDSIERLSLVSECDKSGREQKRACGMFGL